MNLLKHASLWLFSARSGFLVQEKHDPPTKFSRLILEMFLKYEALPVAKSEFLLTQTYIVAKTFSHPFIIPAIHLIAHCNKSLRHKTELSE
jgi:hypothetical protein